MQENSNKGISHIRYEYRRKLDDGYDWYCNITKLLDVNGKKLTLVLVENINENIMSQDVDQRAVEMVKAQQKNVFAKKMKKIKKVLAFFKKIGYNIIRGCDIQRNIFGVSPNGKATDSDSVISRFESL